MERWTYLLLCVALAACAKHDASVERPDCVVPVTINEVAATSTDVSDLGEASDWLELYNAGSPVQLEAGEWYLTDDREDLLKFELPDLALGEAQHLRIWCDGFGSELDDIHASFSLAAGGEWIALVRLRDGLACIIDSVRYAPQQARLVLGASRFPDGAAAWVMATRPTPGAPNAASAQAP